MVDVRPVEVNINVVVCLSRGEPLRAGNVHYHELEGALANRIVAVCEERVATCQGAWGAWSPKCGGMAEENTRVHRGM